jgi:predicted nucleic-acid-binding Zn-ribbon protein
MTEMQRYERDATCPKCGSTDIAAEYKAASSGAERWASRPIFSVADLEKPVPDWMWDIPEYILRTCRWCKYSWSEEPLDVPVRDTAQRAPGVKTTDD